MNRDCNKGRAIHGRTGSGSQTQVRKVYRYDVIGSPKTGKPCIQLSERLSVFAQETMKKLLDDDKIICTVPMKLRSFMIKEYLRRLSMVA